MKGERPAPGWLQPTIDYGPLGIFFLAYCVFDILAATAAMLVATAAALAASLVVTRRVSLTTLVTSGMMLVFGGLTLWLSDPRYLKLQSTVINGLFSLLLFAALVFGWPLLRIVLGPALPMSEAVWRILTLRFAVFFAAMTAANELISRTQSTDIWVDWNVFGQTIVTIAFLAAQWRLLDRGFRPAPASPPEPPGEQS